MDNLPVIEHKGQRVLLTAHLAESYGTDNRRISENYNSNKERYKLEKHYFVLEGSGLKRFVEQYGNSVSVARVSKLYLWTKKGSLLHAKSLGTDEAWDAYEMLVDDYFDRVAQLPASMTQSELIVYLAQQNVERERAEAEQNRRISAVEKRIEDATGVLALTLTDWRNNVRSILNKIAQKRGGHEAYPEVTRESYELLEKRGNYKLSVRQSNIRKRLSSEGASKSKINAISKLDAVAEDSRLTEIYLSIVKEMAIKYGIGVED